MVGGLPIALAQRGHRVFTIAPRYDQYSDAWDTTVTVNVLGEDGEQRTGVAWGMQASTSFVMCGIALKEAEKRSQPHLPAPGPLLPAVRFFHTVKKGVHRVWVSERGEIAPACQGNTWAMEASSHLTAMHACAPPWSWLAPPTLALPLAPPCPPPRWTTPPSCPRCGASPAPSCTARSRAQTTVRSRGAAVCGGQGWSRDHGSMRGVHHRRADPVVRWTAGSRAIPKLEALVT